MKITQRKFFSTLYVTQKNNFAGIKRQANHSNRWLVSSPDDLRQDGKSKI